MWQHKGFKKWEDREAWIAANQSRYQIIRTFINNGYGVEYRRLIKPRMPR